MNCRTLFLLNSLFAFLPGAICLVVPTVAIHQFGVDSYTSTRLMAQFFGTAMLALGLLLWFVKDVANEPLQRGMGIAMSVGSSAGLGITVLGAFTGTLRSNSWMAIVVYFLFGFGLHFCSLLGVRRRHKLFESWNRFTPISNGRISF
jgi:hypothetical protein